MAVVLPASSGFPKDKAANLEQITAASARGQTELRHTSDQIGRTLLEPSASLPHSYRDTSWPPQWQSWSPCPQIHHRRLRLGMGFSHSAHNIPRLSVRASIFSSLSSLRMEISAGVPFAHVLQMETSPTVARFFSSKEQA